MWACPWINPEFSIHHKSLWNDDILPGMFFADLQAIEKIKLGVSHIQKIVYVEGL